MKICIKSALVSESSIGNMRPGSENIFCFFTKLCLIRRGIIKDSVNPKNRNNK